MFLLNRATRPSDWGQNLNAVRYLDRNRGCSFAYWNVQTKQDQRPHFIESCGYSAARINRGGLLLLAAGGTVASCSNDVSLPRRLSVVLHSDPYADSWPPFSLPDTVRRGVPFTVTFITVYDSPICWKPDGVTSVRTGGLTSITPWEAWVFPPGQDGPCDLLQVGVRSATVTLKTPGIDTIRVVGRVDPYGTAIGS